MKHLSTLATLVIVFFICFKATAQEKLIIDLAIEPAKANQHDTIFVDSKKDYLIWMTNFVVDGSVQYGVSVNETINIDPPLPAPGGASLTETLDPCEQHLDDFLTELQTTTKEQLVDQLVYKFEATKPVGCTTMYRDLVSKNIHRFRASSGASITVTIKRGDVIWARTYRCAPKGQWEVSFGLASPTGVSSWSRNQNYYCAEDPTNLGKYIIKKGGESPSDWKPIPTVFYSWHPFHNRYINYSVTGGLGLDLVDPVFLVGGTFIIKYNLSISTGMIVSKKWRLDTRYSEGQTIETPLEYDQLHKEKYRPDLYIAVAFR
ncbi:MAG: hypothetical protein IT270_19045, partial [Saprospiraceae bacterium]|nr:hypothetical protein [Saprospiraceae bacterium]